VKLSPAVILNAVKDLTIRTQRSFAPLRMTERLVFLVSWWFHSLRVTSPTPSHIIRSTAVAAEDGRVRCKGRL